MSVAGRPPRKTSKAEPQAAEPGSAPAAPAPATPAPSDPAPPPADPTPPVLRDMILGALEDAGGRAYLATLARENPNGFMTLVGKILSLQGAGSGGSGAGEDGTVRYEQITRRIVDVAGPRG